MKKNEDGTYQFTDSEMDCLIEFMQREFYSHWDHYTDVFITKRDAEEIKREHDSMAYDLLQDMQQARYS
jgi:hypothetical protein